MGKNLGRYKNTQVLYEGEGYQITYEPFTFKYYVEHAAPEIIDGCIDWLYIDEDVLSLKSQSDPDSAQKLLMLKYIQIRHRFEIKTFHQEFEERQSALYPSPHLIN